MRKSLRNPGMMRSPAANRRSRGNNTTAIRSTVQDTVDGSMIRDDIDTSRSQKKKRMGTRENSQLVRKTSH